MKTTRFVFATVAGAAMGILILDGKTALSGGKEGIELCLYSLIPSLFPFLVVSDLLTGALMGMELPLLRPAARILRIPGGCAPFLIPGFLGGYPAGAQAIGRAFRAGKIPEDTARRLVLLCSNAGPSFLFGVLGNLFADRGQVWALLAVQILSAVLCARMLPPAEEGRPFSAESRLDLPGSVAAGIRAMAGICGWVILFRVILAFGEKWLLRFLPTELAVVLTGMLELTNGCFGLQRLADPRLRFVLCSAMLSFGGICVTMQTAQVIQPLPVRPYIGYKLKQGVFSLLISAGIQYRQPILLAAAAVLWLLLKKTVAKRQNVVYNGPINLWRNPLCCFVKK